MADTITIEQYMAAVPACCALITIEDHEEIMMCWGLLLAVRTNHYMNCDGCEYNTSKYLTDFLCAVCGRPPHPCDDPECIPANKPIAEKLKKAIEMLEERNELLREAHDAMRAAEPLCDGEVTERFGWLRRRIRTMLAHNV